MSKCSDIVVYHSLNVYILLAQKALANLMSSFPIGWYNDAKIDDALYRVK